MKPADDAGGYSHEKEVERVMKILIASSIDGSALDELRRQHEVVCAFGAAVAELKPLLVDRDVLIFRSGVSITAELMDGAPDLKLIIRAGSGLDNVDVDYARGRGLRLERIPGPGAAAVAEMTFALMLALARNVLLADRLLRQGRWAKYELGGRLLTGKTLGIVGVGNIGTQVGRLAAAWGMVPIGCVEYPTDERADELRAQGIELTTLEEVVSTADFVTLHLPLKESTRHLINAPVLAQMKPGAYLVNIARGGIVDEEALCHVLANGHLAGAALDVHEAEGEGKISPLAGLPNVILTPHIGAMTIDSQREIGCRVVELVDELEAAEAWADTRNARVAEPMA